MVLQNKRCVYAGALLLIVMFAFNSQTMATEDFYFFYTSHCSSCHYAQEILQDFLAKNSDISAQYINIDFGAGHQILGLYEEIYQRKNEMRGYVPVIFWGDNVLESKDIELSRLKVASSGVTKGKKIEKIKLFNQIISQNPLNWYAYFSWIINQGIRPSLLMVIVWFILVYIFFNATNRKWKKIWMGGMTFLLILLPTSIWGFDLFLYLQLIILILITTGILYQSAHQKKEWLVTVLYICVTIGSIISMGRIFSLIFIERIVELMGMSFGVGMLLKTITVVALSCVPLVISWGVLYILDRYKKYEQVGQ